VPHAYQSGAFPAPWPVGAKPFQPRTGWGRAFQGRTCGAGPFRPRFSLDLGTTPHIDQTMNLVPREHVAIAVSRTDRRARQPTRPGRAAPRSCTSSPRMPSCKKRNRPRRARAISEDPDAAEPKCGPPRWAQVYRRRRPAIMPPNPSRARLPGAGMTSPQIKKGSSSPSP
jgi:hypothetical protein